MAGHVCVYLLLREKSRDLANLEKNGNGSNERARFPVNPESGKIKRRTGTVLGQKLTKAPARPDFIWQLQSLESTNGKDRGGNLLQNQIKILKLGDWADARTKNYGIWKNLNLLQ